MDYRKKIKEMLGNSSVSAFVKAFVEEMLGSAGDEELAKIYRLLIDEEKEQIGLDNRKDRMTEKYLEAFKKIS